MVLRWGIVSAGKISHDFVNALNSYPKRSNGNVIVGVAARDPIRAKEFAKTHNIQHVFDSYYAMAVSNEIDVAYIGALNPQHFELAKLYLENGKHVLCEKPLCLNEKQTRTLIQISRTKKLFLMEAVWSRFFPTYAALEQSIKKGNIGDPVFVEVNFGVPIETVDRLRRKDLGGSAILDLGVYVLQFAQFVFKDEPIKVTAAGDLNDDGVDVVDTVILEYSGGRRAVLNVHSKIKLWNKATVIGSKGHITLNEPFHAPEEIVHADGKVETYPVHASVLPYNFQNSAGLAYEAEEVKRCIEQGLLESPRMTHEDSILLARLEDTIRKQVGVHYDVDT